MSQGHRRRIHPDGTSPRGVGYGGSQGGNSVPEGYKRRRRDHEPRALPRRRCPRSETTTRSATERRGLSPRSHHGAPAAAGVTAQAFQAPPSDFGPRVRTASFPEAPVYYSLDIGPAGLRAPAIGYGLCGHPVTAQSVGSPGASTPGPWVITFQAATLRYIDPVVALVGFFCSKIDRLAQHASISLNHSDRPLVGVVAGEQDFSEAERGCKWQGQP